MIECSFSFQALSETLAMSPPTQEYATPQRSSDSLGKQKPQEGDIAITWKLPMLKRFNVEKGFFVLACGP